MKRAIRFGTIIVALICLITLSAQAASIYFPLPINGKVVQANQGNIEIQVTNDRTGVTMTTLTNSAGEYLVDWANSDSSVIKYQANDVFKIKVTGCTEAVCNYKAVYTGQPELNHDFQLGDINVVPKEPEEPTGFDWIAALLGAGVAAIIGVAGFLGKKSFTKEEQLSLETEIAKQLSKGSGVRFYKHTDGIVRVRHLHRGIVGYHNPQTNHRDPEDQHPPGKIFI